MPASDVAAVSPRPYNCKESLHSKFTFVIFHNYSQSQNITSQMQHNHLSTTWEANPIL
ncbi:hypothetical protein MPL1032_70092 [Mesorhizobium plurifarium]|uniref:Uncharacterized protein n=1 Tax=Mesorhizobium plurifarium TaxID=69974 RepID=A0A0K2W6I9_MESPL|nr:hypothetical protein MPL1032_70092 [Mesorhizobium plurifarium]